MPKITLRLGFELDEKGVTRVWTWTCPSCKDGEGRPLRSTLIYWENALRSMNYHLKEIHSAHV